MWKVMGNIGFAPWRFVVYDWSSAAFWEESGTCCTTNYVTRCTTTWSMN